MMQERQFKVIASRSLSPPPLFDTGEDEGGGAGKDNASAQG